MCVNQSKRVDHNKIRPTSSSSLCPSSNSCFNSFRSSSRPSPRSISSGLSLLFIAIITLLTLTLLPLPLSSPLLLVSGQTANDLSALTFSAGGSLNPVFAFGTRTYTIDVLFPTATVVFTPKSSGTIQWKYDKSSYLSYTTITTNTASPSITLEPGDNVIMIQAGSGTAYTITIHRRSDDATLSNLLCTQPLTPAFSPTTLSYTVLIANGVTSWTCTPTRSQSAATISHSLNQDTWVSVASNAPAVRPMAVGDNRYAIRVIAEDVAYERQYIMIVHRMSNDAKLAGLTPSAFSLVPTFTSSQLSYNLSVSSSTASLTFRPLFSYTGVTATWLGAVPATTASYVFNGAPTPVAILNNAVSSSLTLLEGDNTFALRLEAEDATTLTYTITIHRISADTKLSSLIVTPTGSGYSPAFAPTAYAYVVNMNNAVTSCTFSFTQRYSLATQYYTVNSGALSASWPSGQLTPPISLPVGDSIFSVLVTAEDLVSTQLYTVRVHRLSIESRLQSLVTSTSLVPSFNAALLSYNMTVGVSVSTFSLTAIPQYSLAQMSVRLNGGTYAALSAGALSPVFALVTGSNQIDVQVVSEDMGYTTIYSIFVHLQSSQCTLQSLLPTPAGSGFVPIFVPATLSYTLSLPSSVDAIVLTSVTAPLATQEWQWNNNPLQSFDSGTPTPSIPISYGDQLIRIKVLAEDRITFQFYVVTVHRAWSISSLGSLVSSIALVPNFNSSRLNYAMTVASSVASIALTPTPSNTRSVLELDRGNGTFYAIANGVSTGAIALTSGGPTLGNTTIRIRVQSEDLAYSTVYTVLVHRISSVATLSVLDIAPVSSGLSPVFSPTGLSYDLSQDASVNSMVLTPTLSYSLARIDWSLNGGSYSLPLTLPGSTPSISLHPGDQTISLRVTAEDGVTRTVYVIRVHRWSSESSLALVTSSLPLAPQFANTTLIYSLVCGQTVSTVTFAPTLTYPLATVQYSFNNGPLSGPVTSGQTIAPAFSLLTGDNQLLLRVISEDLSSTTDYNFAIRRISPTSSLAALSTTPLGFGLVPSFDESTFDYTLTVINSESSLSVRSILTYPAASQTWLFNNVLVGSLTSNTDSSPTPLAVGDQTITVIVLAEDLVSSSTYRIDVRRLSNDSRLGALTTSAALSPAFDAGTMTYTINVGNAVNILIVTSSVGWPRARQQVQFQTDPYSAASSSALSTPFNLPVGNSVVNIRVVSEDTASTSIYTLNIHRQSADATLNSLTMSPSGSGLAPNFDPAVTAYSISVPASVAKVTFTSTLTSALATQQWNFNDGAFTSFLSGASTPDIDLAFGDNYVVIKAAAENMITVRSYRVKVHRVSSNSQLASVTSSVSLSPPFGASQLAYAMNVSSSVTSLTFLPTLSNPFASLFLDRGDGSWVTHTSGTVTSPALALAIGDTTFQLKVQAEDTTQNTIYVIRVHRVSPISSLASLSVLPPNAGLQPLFASGTLAYNLELSSSIASITLTPTLTDARARVAWSLNGGGYSVSMLSGATSPDIALAIGASQLSVRVTAEDGITRTIYTLNIIRLSDVSSLQSLQSSITLTPPFSPTRLAYAMTVAPGVTAVSFIPRSSSASATIRYEFNGGGDLPIASLTTTGSLTLPVGESTLVFRVTSQDTLSTTTTYTLTIYRTSAETSLFSLNIAPVGSGLVPAFDRSVYAYSFRCTSDVTHIQVTSVAVYSPSQQQWSLNNAPWSMLTPNQTMVTPFVALPMGTSTLAVKIIAEDLVSTRTTVVTIRRVSSDAQFASLDTNFVTSPPFAPSETLYHALAVPYATSTITFTPVLPSSLAKLDYSIGIGSTMFQTLPTPLVQNAVANTATTTLSFDLATGNATFNLRTLSEDTFYSTIYVFHVRRLSNDTSLSAISLPTLAPALTPGLFAYSATVDWNVTDVTISACTTYAPFASHRIKSSYMAYESPVLECNEFVTFAVQDNLQYVRISVTAEDGTQAEYVISLLKASNDASVKLIEVVDPSLTLTSLLPLYDSSVHTYHVNMSYPVTSVTLLLGLNHTMASAWYQWRSQSLSQSNNSGLLVARDMTPFTVPSFVGTTLVTLTVRAQNGEVTNVFNISLHRSPIAFETATLPSYFVAAARYRLRLLPAFGNAIFKVLTLRLNEFDTTGSGGNQNGTIVEGTQVTIDTTTPLVFIIDMPVDAQLMKLDFTIRDNPLGYIAPLPIYIPVISGSWSTSLLPNTSDHLFTSQAIALAFQTSQTVAGTIRVEFTATLDGSAYTFPSSQTTVVELAPNFNGTQLWSLVLPPNAGTFVITPKVTGYVPLDPITLVVRPRATLTIGGWPTSLTIDHSVTLSVTPSELPRYDGVTLELATDRANFADGTRTMRLLLPPNSIAPVAFALQTPSSRGNFTLMAKVVTASVPNQDYSHFADPSSGTVTRFVHDACDGTTCGANSVACLAQSGTAFICVCRLGWTGLLCEERSYTGPNTPPTPISDSGMPVAVLKGPSQVAACDQIELDASTSFGLGTVTADRTFTWRLIAAQATPISSVVTPALVPLFSTSTAQRSDGGLEWRIMTSEYANSSRVIVSALPTGALDQSRLLVSARQLELGWTYTFEVTVANSYASSAPVTLSVRVSATRAEWAPHVAILGPTILTSTERAIFQAEIRPSACHAVPTDIEYDFTWTIQRVGTGVASLSASAFQTALNALDKQQARLILPSGFVRPGDAYSIAVTTSMISDASSAIGFESRRRRLLAPVASETSTSTLSIGSTRSSVRANIFGAAVRQRPVDETLELDARDMSGDPDWIATRAMAASNSTAPFQSVTFAWACYEGRASQSLVGAACSYANAPSSISTPLFTLPPNSLSPSAWYTFYLTVTDPYSPSRTASTYVEIYFDPPSASPVLRVNLVDAPSWIGTGTGTMLRLQGVAACSQCAPSAQFTWSWTSLPTLDLTQHQTDVLVLDASALKSSSQYSFQLVVCSSLDSVCTSASHVVGVVSPPQGGSVTVAPESGLGLVTDFTLTASGWVDPFGQDPLAYAFSYIDLSAASPVEVFLSSPSHATSLVTPLPPGRLRIRVHVTNQQLGRVVSQSLALVLVQVASLYQTSPIAYANNVTSSILPGVMHRQQPMRSLLHIAQLVAVSNQLTSTSLDGVGRPSSVSEAGHVLRASIWSQLHRVMGWNLNRVTGVVTPTSPVDYVAIATLARVLVALLKYPSPNGATSLLATSAPFVNALVDTMPRVLTRRPMWTNSSTPSSTTTTVTGSSFTDADVTPFVSGLVSRDAILASLLEGVTSATRNCTDLAYAKSLLTTILAKMAQGTYPGEAITLGTSQTSIQLMAQRFRTPVLGTTGVGSSLSAVEKATIGVAEGSALFRLLQSVLDSSESALTAAASSVDRVGIDPSRFGIFLDAVTLRFARDNFAHCRATRNYDGLRSVLESDLTHVQLALSDGTAIRYNTTSYAPYDLDVTLPFDLKSSQVQPYTFAECGEAEYLARNAPPVTSLQCAWWNENEQQFMSQYCVTNTVSSSGSGAGAGASSNATVTRTSCSCTRAGEFGVVYLVNPSATSAPCAVKFGDGWLLADGIVHVLVAIGSIVSFTRLIARWHHYGGKEQLGFTIVLILYVTLTRMYGLLQFYVAPDWSESMVTTIQLLPYLGLHWVWLCAAFQWFRSYNHLRTIHQRGVGHDYFRPKWSLRPFLQLFILATVASILIFVAIIFIRTDSSVDALYKASLFLYSFLGFVVCLACLAALLPNTHSPTEEEGAGSNGITKFTPIDELEETPADKHHEKTDLQRTITSLIAGTVKPQYAQHEDGASLNGDTPLASPSNNAAMPSHAHAHSGDTDNEKTSERDSSESPRANDAESNSNGAGHRRGPSKQLSVSQEGSKQALQQTSQSLSKAASSSSLKGQLALYMLHTERHFFLRHEWSFMKLLPFANACFFAAISILSFVAAIDSHELFRTGGLGLPYYLLEAFTLASLLAFAVYTSILSGLASKYPPLPLPVERDESKEARDAVTAAAQAAVAAATLAAAQAKSSAAAAPSVQPVVQTVVTSGGDTGKITFDVAQAIFQHQQEILRLESQKDGVKRQKSRSRKSSLDRRASNAHGDNSLKSPMLEARTSAATSSLARMKLPPITEQGASPRLPLVVAAPEPLSNPAFDIPPPISAPPSPEPNHGTPPQQVFKEPIIISGVPLSPLYSVLRSPSQTSPKPELQRKPTKTFTSPTASSIMKQSHRRESSATRRTPSVDHSAHGPDHTRSGSSSSRNLKPSAGDLSSKRVSLSTPVDSRRESTGAGHVSPLFLPTTFLLQDAILRDITGSSTTTTSSTPTLQMRTVTPPTPPQQAASSSTLANATVDSDNITDQVTRSSPAMGPQFHEEVLNTVVEESTLLASVPLPSDSIIDVPAAATSPRASPPSEIDTILDSPVMVPFTSPSQISVMPFLNSRASWKQRKASIDISNGNGIFNAANGNGNDNGISSGNASDNQASSADDPSPPNNPSSRSASSSSTELPNQVPDSDSQPPVVENDEFSWRQSLIDDATQYAHQQAQHPSQSSQPQSTEELTSLPATSNDEQFAE